MYRWYLELLKHYLGSGLSKAATARQLRISRRVPRREIHAGVLRMPGRVKPTVKTWKVEAPTLE